MVSHFLNIVSEFVTCEGYYMRSFLKTIDGNNSNYSRPKGKTGKLVNINTKVGLLTHI